MKKILVFVLVFCMLLPSTALALTTMRSNSGTTVVISHADPNVTQPETVNLEVSERKPNTSNYKKGSVYGPKLSTKELKQVKAVVEKAISTCIKKGMSDAEIIKALVNYLCDVTKYAPDWSKNRANTAWGALVYGEAQCSGYARAMIALLDGVGIESKYVHASKKASNPSHQWIVVKYEGQWYHLDPQMIDDYMRIDTSTYTVTYPRPIVLMSSHMPFETKGIPKTASQDITLQ